LPKNILIMKRTIIKIDEERCNGCGACVTGCHEGALQLIDGKAVMVSELYCDGLGACIGECPVGAIALEEREAEPYSEEAVMERISAKGESVILAHLNHLKEHGETELLRQGLEYLEKNKIPVDFQPEEKVKHLACGCPSSLMREIKQPADCEMKAPYIQPSELRQFPVQLRLLNPHAGFLKGADLLLAADCTAFASGEFHNRFLKGKILAIACPKLDDNPQAYIDKLTEMIDVAQIQTLTALIMEVPCCSGLARIAEMACRQAKRNIPLKVIVLAVNGDVINEKYKTSQC
jgi:ferredoxin